LLGKDKIVSRSYALEKVQEQTSLYTKVAERSVKQNEQLLHFSTYCVPRPALSLNAESVP